MEWGLRRSEASPETQDKLHWLFLTGGVGGFRHTPAPVRVEIWFSKWEFNFSPFLQTDLPTVAQCHNSHSDL